MGTSSSKDKEVKIYKYSGKKKLLKDNVLSREILSKFTLITLNNLLRNQLVESNKKVEISVESSPFYEREDFLFYKGFTTDNSGNIEDKVFKLSKDGNNRLIEESYIALKISTYLAGQYTSILNNKIKVDYIEACLVYLKDGNGRDKVYLMEDYYLGVFFKFTDNVRVTLERKPQHWSEPERLLVDFSHWTYSWTSENLMVVNLQGWWQGQYSCRLTDPGVRFKDSLLGKPEFDYLNNGFIQFLNSHKDICCAKIWQGTKTVPAPQKVPLNKAEYDPISKKIATEPNNLVNVAKEKEINRNIVKIPIAVSPAAAVANKLSEFKRTLDYISQKFDELTKVLIAMERSALSSLHEPFSVIKDMQNILNDSNNPSRIENSADSLLDIILQSYDIIHDKYKNTNYTMLEGTQRKVYQFNRVLNFMCETAVSLYEKYSSRQRETATQIISTIIEEHLKLKFDDRASFMKDSLTKYSIFINKFGSEQEKQGFREAREKNFADRPNIIYEDRSRLQENNNGATNNIKRAESVRSERVGGVAAQKAEGNNEQNIDIEKFMNNLVIELMKVGTKNEESAKIKPKCGLCKSSDFIAYTYRCLICESLNICSTCFENRKSNEIHLNSHPVVRCDENSNGCLFGVEFTNENLNLSTFEDVFKDEVHPNIKCSACNTAPIKGLRFKCDACYDYHVCLDCFKAKNTSKSHSSDHSMVAFGKTESLDIKKHEIQLIGDPLGSGAFGTVYKAKYLTQDKIVACKLIKYDVIKLMLGFKPDDLVNSFIRELTAFKEVKGDNVHRLIGHSPLPNLKGPSSSDFELMIITEFMEKGSLASLLRNERDLSNRKRLHIATGISSGMSRIHDLNFIHRDIRPDNILIDGNYTAKIADMGIAKLYDQTAKMSAIGCRDYMPPEFYTGKYSKKLDIYTFGLTLNELFNGSHQLVQRLRQIKIEKEAEIFYEFVQGCMNNDPNERPEAKQLENDLSLFERCIDSAIYKNLYTYMRHKNEFFKKTYDKVMDVYKKNKADYDLTKRAQPVKF